MVGRTGRGPTALLAISACGLAVAGCTPGSTSPPAPPVSSSSPAAVSTVELPAPSQDGPVVTIAGLADFDLGHPGCIVLRTDAGQVFSLVGPAAAERLGEVRAGTAPHQQRVQTTGHIVQAGAMVCSGQRAFLTTQVTPMNDR